MQRHYEDQFLWFDDAPELRRSGPTAGWVRAAYASCVATTLNRDWMKRLELPVLALTANAIAFFQEKIFPLTARLGKVKSSACMDLERLSIYQKLL